MLRQIDKILGRCFEYKLNRNLQGGALLDSVSQYPILEADHSKDDFKIFEKLLNLKFTQTEKYPHLLSVKNCFIRGSVVSFIQTKRNTNNISALTLLYYRFMPKFYSN